MDHHTISLVTQVQLGFAKVVPQMDIATRIKEFIAASATKIGRATALTVANMTGAAG